MNKMWKITQDMNTLGENNPTWKILPGGGGENESEITATPGITNQI
jgi:hypothetical protein